MEKLRVLAQQYEIQSENIQKLRQLEGFETIIVCDDSGSMSTVVDTPMNDPYARTKTRWDELCRSVTIITELATSLDPNGVDVYFLNRPPIYGVTTAQQIQEAFSYPPQGLTPTVQALNRVFQEKAAAIREKKVLLILATDGEPTTPTGAVNIPEFKAWVANRPSNLFMSVLVCTDDDATVAYLNAMDKSMKNFDVVDDYKSEREEARRAKGPSFPFSFGDYLVKVMLGSIDPAFDNLDESTSSGCCTLL